MSIICLKPIQELEISIVADEETNDMFFVQRLYDEGVEVDEQENLCELDDDIYQYYKLISKD